MLSISADFHRWHLQCDMWHVTVAWHGSEVRSEVQVHLRAEFDSIGEEAKLLSNLKNDIQFLHGQIQQQLTMLSEIE